MMILKRLESEVGFLFVSSLFFFLISSHCHFQRKGKSHQQVLPSY